MRATLAVGLAFAAASGCGDDEPGRGDGGRPGDEPAVRQAVEGYFTAFANGDGQRACARLTGDVREQFEERAGTSCDQAIRSVLEAIPKELRSILTAVRITEVAVSGDQATARLETDSPYVSKDPDSPIKLRLEGDEWLISSTPPTSNEPDPMTTCMAGGLESFEEGDADPLWEKEGRKDFVRYLTEVCRRAVEEGVIDADAEATSAEARGDIRRIGQEVIEEMVRSGRIERP
jgi:hypothetical protein